MKKTLGYFITWTTYGTWLQGETKGYVKDGHILSENPKLRESNIKDMAKRPIKLNQRQKEIAREAILREAKKYKHKIPAIAVCTNHVHIIIEYCGEPIERIVGRYKNAACIALQKDGLSGKEWTRGYDKRYCFDEKSLKDRIDYVRRHD